MSMLVERLRLSNLGIDSFGALLHITQCIYPRISWKDNSCMKECVSFNRRLLSQRERDVTPLLCER